MRFSQDDVQRFAAWSGDHNPLHVDPAAARRSFFGRPVVHGMLPGIRALASRVEGRGGLTQLDIEFRGAVFPDTQCTLERASAASGAVLTLRSGDASLMTLHVNGDRAFDWQPDLSWAQAARSHPGTLAGMRVQPADLDAEAMEPGREVVGVYRTGNPPDGYSHASALTPVHARVLGLCSYVVGMELPGLRSLFTRVTLSFAPDSPDSPELVYRAAIVRFDRQFRILTLRLEVGSPDGTLVAFGELRAYVRFTPAVLEPAGIASFLSEDAKRLAGKVVLVTGGTRGLGAAITTALAVAGCHVHASYQRDSGAAEALADALTKQGVPIELLEGDAGDPAWCASTLAAIVSRHGRLDAVVLNACAPPLPLHPGPDSARAFSEYIAANLPLAQTPVATLLPSLAAAGGTIVFISSSFVAEPPPGFGHYVALKEAAEAIVRSAGRETPGVKVLIARPPRLQTTWNDTPTGVLGTIPPAQAAAHIVERLAADLPAFEILSDFPALARRAPAAVPQGSEPDFSIGLVASFTSEPLLDGLRFWFGELGVRGEIEAAPYAQILQTLLSPGGGLSRRPGMHVVMLRVRDWLRELPRHEAESPGYVGSYLASTARDLERALRTHRSQAAAETLLVLCPSAAGHPGFEEALLDQTEAELVARLSALPGLTVVRASDFHAAYGVADAAIADPVREHIAHIPYQATYFHTLAAIVMRHVFRRLAPARKVVVVDCDNTLWRGVVGEVGPEGLTFDESHLALHARLIRLAQSGVLVALCSKNEESDVWRVFETRDELALKRDHVVAAAINWQPKSANLRSLAGRLNLGLDSFLFLDDNPVECAEVRAACPEVLTLEWPLDPARALRLLEHTWELDPRGATAEDRRRTELYKEEFRRQELQAQTLTFRDFIASLGLAVEIAPLSTGDLKRASQLTLRTNQFNFTTRRREEGEMAALLSEGGFEIRTVRVRDRFGDYGLVGLLIAEVRGEELYADTLLLSCRVLGRGVEHQMLAELGRIAQSRGALTVRVRVEPTKRNTPARSFVEATIPAGFRQSTGGVVEAALPASAAANIVFEPPEQAGPAIAEDDAKKGPASPDSSRLRSREDQIARTAFDLSTSDALAAAIEGKPAPTAGGSADAVPDTAFVYDVFARALGVTTERVRDVDSIEALGCDSFKIVEITVSLLEKFPALPGTLLFEHRSVREIAARVVELSRPASAAPASAVDVRVPAARAGTGGDIAVVGMHVRCAGANSPDELWALLSDGGVAVKPVARDRKYFFGRLEDTRAHFAGLLDDVDRFDAELFGITPREAELMDPQLRLFLEVAWAALEDAGALGAGAEPDTGVFAGIMYGDYGYRANLVARASENPFKCWEGFSLANRVSQVFGFRGPSIAVDTACSSSGTAVHLACRALHAGDCRAAIAGGVNLILDPDRFVQLGRLGILSESGRCLAFGADADGTVLGEGAGVVVLRPLADALERGDRIYGVIKSTGVSTGSGTVGFTAPNPQAQALAIRRTIGSAGIDPRTISYVETHGTGTALGDPIEVRGLSLAYQDPQLWDAHLRGTHACSIGSIKPNIGHLEAGAGVLGLIKLLLQLHRRMLLPSITSEAPNPQIPFEHGPFSIQRRLMPWTAPVMEDRGVTGPVARRGALNSFGVGGANAHVLVEEAPRPAPREAGVERPVQLLAVSARTADSLRGRLRDLAQVLRTREDVELADLCYSVNTGQRHLARRVAAIARTRGDMIASLQALEAGGEPFGTVQGTVGRSAAAPKIAFLFTGQGSQYAGMGRDLYETQPIFRAALDRCFALFDALLPHVLKDCMFAADGSDVAALLNATGCTQPALFSLGYALTELWRSWGIRPDVVMGHSIGEITAMCAAGGLTLEDAATLVAARGSLMQALPPGGAMTSIMAPAARVAAALAGYEDRVAIAAMNGPAQTVVSGEAAAVADIAAGFAAEGVKTKALVVSHAFHSPLMRPMLDDYERVVRRIRLAKPSTPFVSCVLGRVAEAELLAPGYWVRNVIDPVRFTSGMEAIVAAGATAFVEMGPQPVLLGMGRQCVENSDERLWLASIRKDGQSWQSLLSSVAALYAAGADVDWRGFDAPYPRTRVTVPPYRFDGKRHWIDASSTTVTVAPKPLPVEAAPDTHEPRAYEIEWRTAPSPQAASREGDWLLVGGDADVAAAAVEAFQARGARASAWAPDLTDADRVARDLALQVSPLARGIVYVPAPAEGPDAAAAAIAAVERLSVLLRAIAATPEVGRAPLWIATHQAATTGAADVAPVSIAHAALWGLARTFALEHPLAWGGLVDVPADASAGAAAGLIVEEVLSNGGEDQIALRGATRYVARLRPLAAVPVSQPAIRRDATYLVTGGLGAVGSHAARWLARAGAGHIVLTSRRGIATPGARALEQELESLGSQVTIVAADVSQPDDADRVFSAIASLPPLRGVLHAAGIDESRAIAAMGPGDAERVMAGKVRGAWAIHERLQGAALDLFVCFSSIASVLGSAGRGAYAAANGFLDALAHDRRRRQLPALTVNWGPWTGGGMATPAALQQYTSIGNYGLHPDAAIRQLETLLGTGVAQATVADIDWPAFRRAYETRRERPLVRELGQSTSSQEPAAASAAFPWIDRLVSSEAGSRIAVLSDLLRQEVADTLGLESAVDVPADATLQDMGMDSLMSADFAQRLQKRLGIRSTALVFEYPYIELLAAHLVEKLALVDSPAVLEPALAAAGAAGIAPVDAFETLFESEADVAPGPAGRLERYRSGVEREVFEFQQRAWPHRQRDLVAPRWRWMFVESARRLGLEPQVWLHRDGGRIVGHNGAIPVLLKIGSQERPTAWLVDTMVLEEYRSQAVGARLMVEAHEDLPFALSLGQTQQMRAIQLRLGWEQVAPLQTAQLLLRPERVLNGKLPGPAALAAGLGLRAAGVVRGWKQRPQGRVREIARFGASHDALWAAMSSGVTCAVRRDASYLNWKYVDQPGQDFLRLEISDASGVRGVVICMMREPDDAYRYRRAFIVDLVAPISDARVTSEVLQAAITAVGERGADALVCLHISPLLTASLRHAGFRLREPSRFLLVRPGNLSDGERATLLRPESWYVTHGDSDIDRPW